MAIQLLTENATSDQRGADDTADNRDAGAELLRRALDGDQRAWNALVISCTPMLRRSAYRFRIGDEANDAIQTTFMRLLEHGDCIRDHRALRGWLRTTMTNECLRILRRRSRERPLGEEFDEIDVLPAAADQHPDYRAVRKEEITLLRDAIAGLPARDRRLLVLLSDPEVDSYRMVSERMGIPVGSIGPTRGRILLRLRDSLRSAGLEDCAA